MTPDALAFDVNLSTLFTELPQLERPAAARILGFDAVEFWWPFDEAVPPDREVDAFVGSLDDVGLSLVGLNFFAGDPAGGDRGVVSLPARSGEFRDSVDVLAGIAEATGCRRFNALYGNRVEGVAPEAQDELAVQNLSHAADRVAAFGGTVLIEPCSPEGYPLRTTTDALGVIDAVREASGAANLALLADFFHLATNGEAPARVIDAHVDRVGHVQIADVPGRGEPGTGELDYRDLFARLQAAGYHGYIGCEYTPTGSSAESFDWLPREQRSTGSPRHPA